MNWMDWILTYYIVGNDNIQTEQKKLHAIAVSHLSSTKLVLHVVKYHMITLYLKSFYWHS